MADRNKPNGKVGVQGLLILSKAPTYFSTSHHVTLSTLCYSNTCTTQRSQNLSLVHAFFFFLNLSLCVECSFYASLPSTFWHPSNPISKLVTSMKSSLTFTLPPSHKNKFLPLIPQDYSYSFNVIYVKHNYIMIYLIISSSLTINFEAL